MLAFGTVSRGLLWITEGKRLKRAARRSCVRIAAAKNKRCLFCFRQCEMCVDGEKTIGRFVAPGQGPLYLGEFPSTV
jgi:hypothetical protein